MAALHELDKRYLDDLKSVKEYLIANNPKCALILLEEGLLDYVELILHDIVDSHKTSDLIPWIGGCVGDCVVPRSITQNADAILSIGDVKCGR